MYCGNVSKHRWGGAPNQRVSKWKNCFIWGVIDDDRIVWWYGIDQTWTSDLQYYTLLYFYLIFVCIIWQKIKLGNTKTREAVWLAFITSGKEFTRNDDCLNLVESWLKPSTKKKLVTDEFI